MKHRMFRIIILLAGAFLVAGCTANLIYHPCGEVLRTPTDAGLAYEDVVIETSDGVRITGWWVPAADPRGTVLFCHGNGG
ncbi:MAG TPA: alpha/beta hydrolase, partial [Deltaproteobacteria bacterium]|nr:alpha/beta hydrolase [Deltaproteobacteria bacterium]